MCNFNKTCELLQSLRIRRPSVRQCLGVTQVFSGMVRWNLIKLGIVVVVYVLLMHVILFLKWGHSMPLGQVVKGQNCTIS